MPTTTFMPNAPDRAAPPAARRLGVYPRHTPVPAWPTFLGLVTAQGPNGESDYADNRYWVREASVSATDPATYTITPGGRWITVTNATIDPAHGVRDVTQPVRVMAVTHDQHLIAREPRRQFQAVITNVASGAFTELDASPFAARIGQVDSLSDTAIAASDTVLIHEVPQPDGSVTYAASPLDHTLVAVEVVTDYRVDTASNALQKKTRTVYVAKAGAESSWTNVHVGETC